jgi:glycolate oxidase
MTEKTRFTSVTDADVQAFERIVGPAYVRTDPLSLDKYGRDETEDLVFPPEVVVLPASAEEVQAIVRHCYRRRIPITPRAGGTGLSGGALPVFGGVVLSVERMNRIVEIDDVNMMAVVEPGVVTADLQRVVEERGLFYPPDPASRFVCCIGGNVAENAGGPRALKYGTTRDYVYGLDVVLPNGRFLRTGGKLYKDVAGYDLTRLLVGSEGTLGVFTRIVLRLIPKPAVQWTLFVPFDDWTGAFQALRGIFEARLIPAAVEFMDREAVRLTAEHVQRPFPHADAAALLLIQLDGDDPSVVERQALRVGEVCERAGARDVQVADTPARQEALWAFRRAMGEAVKRASVYKEEDTVVPRDRLPELLRAVRGLAERYGFQAVCYGHAGDGNIHVNILQRGLDETTWREVLPRAIRELFEVVVALGGTITGEHGVGWVQRPYLSLALSAESLRLQRRLKRLFDPRGIMNPGKVFPDG